ncbi:MAG TPA: RNA 3'-terminal phosphate cyclase [Anaerolineae bacterium]|nr:RNA 3'-terminal phosphate cyclase [Anaerolineae bacterium]
MSDIVLLDGSYGEGGGQIVRTALGLSALMGRPLHMENIRAGRSSPGLRPQHLAVARAMARICDARLLGDQVGSRSLTFEPRTLPVAGDYVFDIPKMAGTASAGSTALLFQALFLPLALASGVSRLRLGGGTHVPWSPPFHYLTEVYLPVVGRMGFRADLELDQWGWYPEGGGQVVARIEGLGPEPTSLSPLCLAERGRLVEVWGISATSSLPDHIRQRQRDQALRRLRARHIKADIDLVEAPSPGPGTMLFLLSRYEHISAGFTGYGRIRYPAEKVADDAATAFEEHRASEAALDPYLADQVLLPMALVPGTSCYTTSRITRHLLTNRWVIQRFIEREIHIEGEEGGRGKVTVL